MIKVQEMQRDGGSPMDTSMDNVHEEESCNMEVEEGTVSEDDREEINVDDEDKGTREGGNSRGSSRSRQGSPHSMHRYFNRCHQSCNWAEWNEMEDKATFGEFSTRLDSMGEDGSEGNLNALLPFPQNEQDPFSRQTTTRKTPTTLGSPLPEDDIVVHMMEEELNSFEN